MKTLEKLKFRIDNQFSEVIDKTKYGWLSAYGFKRDEIDATHHFRVHLTKVEKIN